MHDDATLDQLSAADSVRAAECSAATVGAPTATAAPAVYETACFDANRVEQEFGIDPRTHCWAEIPSDTQRGLYESCIEWLGKHGTVGSAGLAGSFQPHIRVVADDHDDDDGNDETDWRFDRLVRFGLQKPVGKCKSSKKVTLAAGLGLTEVTHMDADGKKWTIKALLQRRGPVIGTQFKATTWESLVLFVEGRENREVLVDFIAAVVNVDVAPKPSQYKIFRYMIDYTAWKCCAIKTARTMESVVLPMQTKNKITEDLDGFLTPHTMDFYTSHGIPYKRSYLFYGVPGAGKTSLLTALAGKYERNLCLMQPTDPRFTDHTLSEAIREAPPRSIIVLEDIDALFTRDREAASQKLPLTFSGLLNALDGIGNPDGQIFVLTTNFRDKLDAALIRNGRVDLHVEFAHATSEQMESIFLQFYPGESSERAVAFRKKVQQELGEKKTNMAALQHFFIRMMRKSASEAIESVELLVEDHNEKRSASQGQSELYM